MKKLTKRDFFKGVGFFSLITVFVPWLRQEEKGIERRSYPIKVAKDPNAVARPEGFG